MAKIWQKKWSKYGHNMVKIWPKKWSKYGQKMVKKISNSGQKNMSRISQKST